MHLKYNDNFVYICCLVSQITRVNFTVMCLVTWPLYGSEVGVGFVLIRGARNIKQSLIGLLLISTVSQSGIGL